MGNPKLVTSVSVVKFRFEWEQNKHSFGPFMRLDLELVHLVSQNCPVCLSLVDDKLCLCFLAFSPPFLMFLLSLFGLVWLRSHPSKAFQS